MEREWKRMRHEIRMANQVPSNTAEAAAFRADLQTGVRAVVEHCRAARKRKRESALVVDTSDERLFEGARFTDHLPLANYENVLHLVPRLVNIVSLAEAVPMPGSGVKLPLNLHAIGARCSNAYYAPKRFAAVQLAFSNPRCRVLVFHTGRFVGTGAIAPFATFPAAFLTRAPLARRRVQRPDGRAPGHPEGGAAAGRRGGRARRAAQVCGDQPGGRGFHRREARLRSLCLDALGHVALRSCELRRSRVAPGRRADLLWCAD